MVKFYRMLIVGIVACTAWGYANAFDLEEAFKEGINQVMHQVGNGKNTTSQKRAQDENKLERGGAAQLKHKKAKRIPLKAAMEKHSQNLLGAAVESFEATFGVAGGLMKDFVPDFNKKPSILAEGGKYMRLVEVIQTTANALTTAA